MTQGATLPDLVYDAVVQTARRAGDKILVIYEKEVEVEIKGDGSPLTKADKAAHNEIVESLARITPDVPVLSEESIGIEFAERNAWSTYWLVDPLDGTKEFIKRNGEFTVNIALMQDNKPVWGVVHVPVTDTTYFGGREMNTVKHINGVFKGEVRAAGTTNEQQQLNIVASRSHLDPRLENLFTLLTDDGYSTQTINVGSSLKFCMIAEGRADFYPRLGLTSEWDTAAAQAVLEGAGGKVIQFSGEPMQYNKENILNPFFLATTDLPASLESKLLSWYNGLDKES